MEEPDDAIRRQERSRASLNIRVPVLGNVTAFLFCVKNHAFLMTDGALFFRIDLASIRLV